jgi:hypothetical protein
MAMETIAVRLAGPFGFGCGGATQPLFGAREAWQPGVYVWTFEVKQSDRIVCIGSSGDSVAHAHTRHLAAYWRGDYLWHMAAARDQAAPQHSYLPAAGRAAYHEHFADLRAELVDLRLFYAPLPAANELPARVAWALTERMRRLGGRATEWLVHVPVSAPAGEWPALTARLYRPVYMASMPDELTV